VKVLSYYHNFYFYFYIKQYPDIFLRPSTKDTAVRSLRRRFEAQTQTFLPALYGAARRLMSGPAEAEAVVTEVYGRAYRAFQEPTDRGLLKR
jgi:DNA-directed RNA polymerase specialized sigma24 family protein